MTEQRGQKDKSTKSPNSIKKMKLIVQIFVPLLTPRQMPLQIFSSEAQPRGWTPNLDQL